MDIQRKNVGKRKAIRWTVTILVILGSGVGIAFALSRLKPAAPGVPLSTLWPDEVKRGPMIREVSGIGSLVPEDTLVIPAQTAGRIERILIQPGNAVRADSVVMILTSPELETDLKTAEYQAKSAEADYQNLKATLQKEQLSLQSVASQPPAALL